MAEIPMPEKLLGPHGLGYAYLPSARGVRVGLCARHRADGSPRLLFDLTINYYRSSPQHGLPHSRLLAVEFSLDRRQPLPPNVGVLIGRRTWEELKRRPQPPRSDPLREWRVATDITSSWRGETVSLLPWSVELRWPVLRSESGLTSPRTGIIAHELALWHGRETVCMLNPDWIKAEGFGELICDDEATCFFPTPH